MWHIVNTKQTFCITKNDHQISVYIDQIVIPFMIPYSYNTTIFSKKKMGKLS